MKKGDLVWGSVLLAIVLFLILPVTNYLFTTATKNNPYLMGFIKFAVLASMGDLLVIRIVFKGWKKPQGLIFRVLVWGIIGVLGTMMFQFYPAGLSVVIDRGYFFQIYGWVGTVISAFLSSAIMNLTFAPMFMAAHRVTDSYIDSRCRGEKFSLSEIINKIDWLGFIKFVVLKTIPFFWIPVHTITFLLPSEYRVIFAALLSIVLGAVLSYSKHKNTISKDSL